MNSNPVFILSNITTDTLAIAVSKTINANVLTIEGYNTWVQELITAQFSKETKPSFLFVQ